MARLGVAVFGAMLLLSLWNCTDSQSESIRISNPNRLLKCYTSAKTEFLRGVKLYERKNYNQASAVFERIIKECPDAPFGWHGRTILAIAEKRLDKASQTAAITLKKLQAVRRVAPNLWGGYEEFLLGVCFVLAKGDVETAKRHYKRSCELGEGRGCSNYGNLIEQKDRNPKLALKWYEKGCKLKYGRSCTNAGVIAEKVLDNPESALSFYERGCALEHATGCRNAALLLAKQTSKESHSRIVELFKKACELGDSGSCEMLKEFEEERPARQRR